MKHTAHKYSTMEQVGLELHSKQINTEICGVFIYELTAGGLVHTGAFSNSSDLEALLDEGLKEQQYEISRHPGTSPPSPNSCQSASQIKRKQSLGNGGSSG